MVTSRPSPGGTMRGPSEAGEPEPMAEMLQRRPGPQGNRDRGPEAARQSYAYPPGPAAPGTFQPAHGPCVPPLPPSD